MFGELEGILNSLKSKKKLLDLVEYVVENDIDIDIMSKEYFDKKVKYYKMRPEEIKFIEDNRMTLVSILDDVKELYIENKKVFKMLRVVIGKRDRRIKYDFESILNDITNI